MLPPVLGHISPTASALLFASWHALPTSTVQYVQSVGGPSIHHGMSPVLCCLSVRVQAGKLAYSAHDYGPFVAPLTWFWDPAFPKNLKYKFWDMWGQVIQRGIAPVWVGEFGSFMPPPTNDLNYRETATFKEQVAYIGEVRALCTVLSGSHVHRRISTAKTLEERNKEETKKKIDR